MLTSQSPEFRTKINNDARKICNANSQVRFKIIISNVIIVV